MQSLLKIISLGLTVSMKALSLDFNKKNNTSQNIQELRGLIENSTQSLQKAISLSADRVIDKIEQDKIEDLISRIKNIDLLLRMKKDEQLFLYVLQLKESVDYAKNRLSEGKQNWLMPYMVGLGMVNATFSYLGEKDLSTSEELIQLISDTRKKILDEVTTELVKQGKEIPWNLIKNILNNENETNSLEKYLELLPTETTNVTYKKIDTTEKVSTPNPGYSFFRCPSCSHYFQVKTSNQIVKWLICPKCGRRNINANSALIS